MQKRIQHKITLLIFGAIVLAVSGSLCAQEEPDSGIHGCATEWLQANIYGRIAVQTESCPTYGACDTPENRDEWIDFANSPVQVVRLFIHIVTEDDGSNPAATYEEVLHSLQTMNDAFKPYRVQFIHDWQYLHSTEFRWMYTWEEWEDMVYGYAVDASEWVNVFITYEENMGPSLYDSWAPMAWWPEAQTPGGSVYLNSAWYDMFGSGNDQILIHEFGHLLGLYHTFNSTEPEDLCGPCWESPGAEGRDTTGDFCSDTEPHILSYTCSPPGGWDPCTATPWNDQNWDNVMGYAWPPQCRRYLTAQQGARMRCWLNDHLSSWIYCHWPFLEPSFSDTAGGDGDSKFEAGETIQIGLTLTNHNDFAVSGAEVRLVTTDPYLNITNGSVSAIEIPPDSTITTAVPLEFEIPVDHFAVIDSFFLIVSWEEYDFADTVIVEQTIGQPAILIVDDDRGSSYQSLYSDDLASFRLPSDIWECAAAGPVTGGHLSGYEMVVWFTGDSTDDYLDPADITAMEGYLDGGGGLFLTGQGLADELHHEDSAFLEDYLHCRLGDTNWFPEHDGIDGSPIGDGGELVYNNTHNQVVTESQELLPVGDALAAFEFKNTVDGYSALSYAGSHRVVFFGFGYEALRLDASTYLHRDEVMYRVVQFLLGTGPLCMDSDGDGYGDPGQPGNECPDDNCPDLYNPDQNDFDDDGLGDHCDNCLTDYNPGQDDNDLDLIGDSCDNCALVNNPDQEDSDSDMIGDVCDECTDTDGDGYGDPGFSANTCTEDNCPGNYNPDQADTDEDGVGDECEFVPEIWDTLYTACTRLCINNESDMGSVSYPDGGANMDYSWSGDCNTNNTMYLWSGSAIIAYVNQETAITHADHEAFEADDFVGVVGSEGTDSTQTTEDYQVFSTGTLLTSDSVFGFEVTSWAPSDPELCHLIVQRKKIFKYRDVSVTSVRIGDVLGWLIPTSGITNTGGFDADYNLVYQQGQGLNCQDDSHRFGGLALLGYFYHGQSTVYGEAHGAYVERNSVYLWPAHQLVPAEAMAFMSQPGFRTTSFQENLHSVMTYVADPVLEMGDTLTIYSAIISLMDGTVDTLRDDVVKARQWSEMCLGVNLGCCTERTGNIDGDSGGVVDIGDLTALISYLFIPPNPTPLCLTAANVDGDQAGIIDIGDLTSLIAYLFIPPNPAPADCQ